MAVTVYIPTPFRRATGNRDRVEVRARDVRAMLDELEAAQVFSGREGGVGPSDRREERLLGGVQGVRRVPRDPEADVVDPIAEAFVDPGGL